MDVCYREQQILEQSNEFLIIRRYQLLRDSPKAKQLLWYASTCIADSSYTHSDAHLCFSPRRLLWTGLGTCLLGLLVGMTVPRLR